MHILGVRHERNATDDTSYILSFRCKLVVDFTNLISHSEHLFPALFLLYDSLNLIGCTQFNLVSDRLQYFYGSVVVSSACADFL